MNENRNHQNIELSIEPALENIEQVEKTSTPKNIVQVVNDTQEDQTDIQIHNLEKKIINLCGKIYNLKQTKENKQKVIDQSTYPDYIKLYENHANFSKQYLKNINCVIKLYVIHKFNSKLFMFFTIIKIFKNIVAHTSNTRTTYNYMLKQLSIRLSYTIFFFTTDYT